MAEPYEIAFAIESQRQAIADAVAGAVKARKIQERQECRERRERHACWQDRGLDALKHAQHPRARTAGAKATAMDARGTAGTDSRQTSRISTVASMAFWEWLAPAVGVIVGTAVMLTLLVTACFLL